MPALTDLLLPGDLVRPQRQVLEEVCRRTLANCERLGLIRPDRMSKSKYLAGRFELLAALSYPDADVDQLVLCNDFHLYLFYVDDQAEEDERYGKNPELLQRYFEGHVAALRDGRLLPADDAAGCLLLELRQQLLQRASRAWLERFADDVRDYLLRGTLAGARHWSARTVPEVDEYLAQRAWDSAVLCAQALFEVAGGGELPDAVTSRADFCELRRLCANVVAFTNDLVSYPKEVRRHSSPNNLVHVIMTHEGLTMDRALARVIELVNQDAVSFERIASELPTFDPETTARVGRYLAGQRAWMAANLRWSIETGRYTDVESPFPELRVPHELRAYAREDVSASRAQPMSLRQGG